MSGCDDVPAPVILPVVPFHFRSGVLEVAPEPVRKDYDSFRRPVLNSSESMGKVAAEGVDLDALL